MKKHQQRKYKNENEEGVSIVGFFKDIKDVRELSYTQFKLKLEDIQLIYANRSNEKKR